MKLCWVLCSYHMVTISQSCDKFLWLSDRLLLDTGYNLQTKFARLYSVHLFTRFTPTLLFFWKHLTDYDFLIVTWKIMPIKQNILVHISRARGSRVPRKSQVHLNEVPRSLSWAYWFPKNFNGNYIYPKHVSSIVYQRNLIWQQIKLFCVLGKLIACSGNKNPGKRLNDQRLLWEFWTLILWSMTNKIFWNY